MKVAPKVVIISECFEDKEYKEKLLAGVCRVFGKDVVYGGATYGSFTQQGCTDFDSVCLLGIGGDGVGVSAALVTELGSATVAVPFLASSPRAQPCQAARGLVAAKPPAPRSGLACDRGIGLTAMIDPLAAINCDLCLTVAYGSSSGAALAAPPSV